MYDYVLSVTHTNLMKRLVQNYVKYHLKPSPETYLQPSKIVPVHPP